MDGMKMIGTLSFLIFKYEASFHLAIDSVTWFMSLPHGNPSCLMTEIHISFFNGWS